MISHALAKSKSGQIWIKKLLWYLLNAGRVTMTQMRNKWSLGFHNTMQVCWPFDNSRSIKTVDKANNRNRCVFMCLCYCCRPYRIWFLVFFCLFFLWLLLPLLLLLTILVSLSFCPHDHHISTNKMCPRAPAHTQTLWSTAWKCVEQQPGIETVSPVVWFSCYLAVVVNESVVRSLGSSISQTRQIQVTH